MVPENLVLNLSQVIPLYYSKVILTSDQIAILSRGLSFNPTPGEPDMAHIFLDLERFFRILRLKRFRADHNKHSTTEDTSSDDGELPPPFFDKQFIEKSTFDPLIYNQGTFDVFQKAIRHKITKQPIRTPRYNNTNKKELEALKQLAHNPNIVIRKADKGSCVVVQDIVKYLDECFKQLSNQRFYMRETRTLTLEQNKKVHNLVNELMEKGSISDEVAKHLKISNPRTATSYTLQKIHKNVNPTPGRPILRANDSPTERITAFLDHFLQTYVPLMRSFVKDYTFCKKKVQSIGQAPKNTLLVTLDVVSLYTNIPHHQALAIISRLLHAKSPASLKPSIQYLIRLLALVLSLNHFELNKTFWTQRGGVAMGSKVSPTVVYISREL